MKNITLGLVILIMFSCGNKTQDSPSFEVIDVSMFDGWTDFYSLKISNDGNAYVLNDKHRKGKTYYRIILGNAERDSISSLVKIILSEPLDTLYENSCVDCSSYNLIIKTKDKKFKSFVHGVNESNTQIGCMTDLISYLHKIAETSIISADSVFVFESRTKYFSSQDELIPPMLDDNEKKRVDN